MIKINIKDSEIVCPDINATKQMRKRKQLILSMFTLLKLIQKNYHIEKKPHLDSNAILSDVNGSMAPVHSFGEGCNCCAVS
jgi:hypothetical protein